MSASEVPWNVITNRLQRLYKPGQIGTKLKSHYREMFLNQSTEQIAARYVIKASIIASFQKATGTMCLSQSFSISF